MTSPHRYSYVTVQKDLQVGGFFVVLGHLQYADGKISRHDVAHLLRF